MNPSTNGTTLQGPSPFRALLKELPSRWTTGTPPAKRKILLARWLKLPVVILVLAAAVCTGITPANSKKPTTANVLRTWRYKAVQLSGDALDCGHLIPEEDPKSTLAELRNFSAPPGATLHGSKDRIQKSSHEERKRP
jgi:hypothetical protein